LKDEKVGLGSFISLKKHEKRLHSILSYGFEGISAGDDLGA
jgi:hypothetical protein